MNTNHRILQLMLALNIIKLEEFYSITIGGFDLHLQGHYKSNLTNSTLFPHFWGVTSTLISCYSYIVQKAI